MVITRYSKSSKLQDPSSYCCCCKMRGYHPNNVESAGKLNEHDMEFGFISGVIGIASRIVGWVLAVVARCCRCCGVVSQNRGPHYRPEEL